jgi:hypothetical protein
MSSFKKKRKGKTKSQCKIFSKLPRSGLGLSPRREMGGNLLKSLGWASTVSALGAADT